MNDLLIGVFGSNEFTTGFELVGIKAVINTAELDEQQRHRLLFETMKRGDLGVLIIEEKSLVGLSSQDRLIVENYLKPVVVILTDKPNDGSLRRQITRAIGVDVYEH